MWFLADNIIQKRGVGLGTRFEVGDVITGKQIATEQYSVTIRGTIMEVVHVSDGMIYVKVIGVDESMASVSIEMAHLYRNQHDQIHMTNSQIAMIRRDVENGSKFTVYSKYFEAYIPDEDYASKLNDFLDEM